ncbi:hypothetical protein R3P38DRAFT_3335461 [Favolaschia claudopus]|uniref:Uncharacterized protein n=1 Tax=Favolaschia claudopus TaxID=2862362 RepID=A0AAV9Z9R5_9AGAR
MSSFSSYPEIGVPFNLLANRSDDVPLGPFDSRVSAVLTYDGESYYVLTNTDYVPALPVRPNHSIVLRQDMRYGEHDPTLWPQNYSANFCHLAAIQAKPLGKLGQQREISVMWWNPTLDDFLLPGIGSSITRGLGKLKGPDLARLLKVLREFVAQSKTVGAVMDRVRSFFDPLVKQIRLGLERLESLPSTFVQAVTTVTALQRAFLEADALLRYMTVFKPRMELNSDSRPPPAENCVGVFTMHVEVAQHLRDAGLPYWLLQPTFTFRDANILEIVTPRQPADYLTLDPAEVAQPVPSKPDIDSKIDTIHHPFASSTPLPPAPQTPPTNQNNVGTSAKRYEPYPLQYSTTASSSSPRPHHRPPPRGSESRATGSSRGSHNPRSGRDKFMLLDRQEMPSSIPAWEDALKGVDRSVAPLPRSPNDGHYVLPEPGLIISSDDPARRQLFLHHINVLMDALLYRLSDPAHPHQLLSSQQWRDVLVGKAVAGQREVVHGKQKQQTKASMRSVVLHDLVGPALWACGLIECAEYPAAVGSFPLVSLNRSREILWLLAETNFRFEFVALDRRASGQDREDECRECFVGGMLMGMPTDLGKKGLASMTRAERLPFLRRIAKLMSTWDPRPRSAVIAESHAKNEWSGEEIVALEEAVATHYTQCFYRYFGRAAVIPMRIVHELGT